MQEMWIPMADKYEFFEYEFLLNSEYGLCMPWPLHRGMVKMMNFSSCIYCTLFSIQVFPSFRDHLALCNVSTAICFSILSSVPWKPQPYYIWFRSPANLISVAWLRGDDVLSSRPGDEHEKILQQCPAVFTNFLRLPESNGWRWQDQEFIAIPHSHNILVTFNGTLRIFTKKITNL